MDTKDEKKEKDRKGEGNEMLMTHREMEMESETGKKGKEWGKEWDLPWRKSRRKKTERGQGKTQRKGEKEKRKCLSHRINDGEEQREAVKSEGEFNEQEGDDRRRR